MCAKPDITHLSPPTQCSQLGLRARNVPKLLLLIAVCFLVFWPNVRLPRLAADWSHDLGYPMSYEFYAKFSYQFGVEVVTNVGPYGYLQFPDIYSGLLPTQKVIFILAFAAIFSTMVLLASRYFATPLRQAVWLLPVVSMQFAIGPLIDSLPLGTGVFSALDPICYLFLLLASHHLLTRDRYGFSVFFDTLLLAFLALISLTKCTNLMLVAAIMAVTLLQDLSHKRFRRGVAEAACFVAATVFLWLLARQRLVHFPRFLWGIFSYTNAYNETMELSFSGEGYLVGLAVVVFLVYLAANAIRLRCFRKFQSRFPLTVLEVAVLFIAWKHGYTRADHVIFFWTFILPASSLLFLAHEHTSVSAAGVPATASSLPRVWRKLQVLAGGQVLPLFQTAAVMSIAIVALSSKELHLETLFGRPQPSESNSLFSLSEVFSFRERFAWLAQALQENRARSALPDVKKAVGTATIDQYGSLPGLILLNNLTYRPRPMPWTSLATCDDLMQRNAEFYRRDATAPQYILACVGTWNDRFAPQDDSLAMLQLLHRYRPLVSEKDLVLLRRIPAAAEEPIKRPMAAGEYAWGDRIPVPLAPGQLLWCEVEYNSSLAGQCRSFFYKPAPVRLILESSVTTPVNYRFLACAGRVGFLIDPLILNNNHLLLAYGIKTDPPEPIPLRPDAMFLQVELEFRACFQDKIAVSFFALDKN
jgi:hypothetical protein